MSLQTMKAHQVYLVCEKTALKYSQDYCEVLIKLLGWQYLLYETPQEVKIDPNHIYIFRLVVPDHVLKLPLKQLAKFGVLNTEQLNKSIWFDRMQSYSNLGLKIITYDKYQSLILPYLTHYLPYPIIDTEIHKLSKFCKQPKIYDVVFCTANSPRRQQLLVQLRQAGLKVVEALGWGDQRDQVIGQSKILVNVHYDQTYNIFEHIRCDRWILAGLLVVTEESSSHQYRCLDVAELMTTIGYESMLAKIKDMITNYNHYQTTLTNKIGKLGVGIQKSRQAQCLRVNKLLSMN